MIAVYNTVSVGCPIVQRHDTYLVGKLECPSVHAIVRGIQLSLGEPSDIALNQVTTEGRLEGCNPIDGLASDLRKGGGARSV
jgi:hypothetical protein